MQSNDLTYHASKIFKKYGQKHKIYVDIQLNDQCNNGHQDFSITGSIYSSVKSTADKYFVAGGCIHDDILKHFPEFRVFVDLHLCDFDGNPMYAIANGRYHLSTMERGEFTSYYRISEEQYSALRKAKGEIEYAAVLGSSGVLEQWKKQAKEGISMLEKLTGQTFLNDSKRSNLCSYETDSRYTKDYKSH